MHVQQRKQLISVSKEEQYDVSDQTDPQSARDEIRTVPASVLGDNERDGEEQHFQADERGGAVLC